MKIKPYSHFILLVIAATFLTGCEEKKIIQEEKFIDVYSDLIIAQDTSTVSNNFQRDSIQQIIFKRYSVSKDEYSSTVEYYSEEPARWEKFFNTVIDSLEARKQRAAKQL